MVSLVTARIVSLMDNLFSISLIQNIQVMLVCGFAWLFLVEILRLGCHYSNYSQIKGKSFLKKTTTQVTRVATTRLTLD